MAEEMQELHCHECQQYVQFKIDTEANGNFRLDCPNCGHQHFRTIENGKITEMRWGVDPRQREAQMNGMIQATATGSTVASTFTTYSGPATSDQFLYQSWMNSTTATS